MSREPKVVNLWWLGGAVDGQFTIFEVLIEIVNTITFVCAEERFVAGEGNK